MIETLKAKRKEALLAVILVAIAVTLWQNFGGGSTVGTLGAPGRGPGARTDLAALHLYPVDWAVLTAERPAYDPASRNIFQFGFVPPPPPPKLSAAEEAAIREAQAAAERERQRQLEAAQAAQVAAQTAAAEQANLPPPPPPKPQPPPVNYKFIGYVGPPENKIAILHDGTDLVFARRGDTLGKDFRILEIGYESIKFGFTDPRFRGETQTLPMSSSY